MYEVKEIDEKVLLIRISRAYYDEMSRYQLYEYTRGRWKIKLEHARQAEYALAIFKGEVKEVYRIVDWYESGEILSQIIDDNNEYDKPKEHFDKRVEFVGRVAQLDIRRKYINKSVAHFFKKGEASPVKYINC